MKIEPDLLHRIIAFQDKVAALYIKSHEDSFDLCALDRGMHELSEIWESVKDSIEASEEEEVD